MLSIGHGYSARRLAHLLVPQGWQISGTTRSDEKMARIAASGVEPVLWPGTDLGDHIAAATHLLISAGPTEDGDPFLAEYADVLRKHAPRLTWVGYLSTTGVYGDHGGDWVDENTPVGPSTKRGQARVDAETAWQAIEGLPLHIFRLAGIYGAERGPFAKLRNGTARRIIKPNQVFSRIHVDDIAQALALSIAAPRPGAIYNLCDDDPAPPQDVIAYAAELLGMPAPPEEAFETAEMSPMARSFYSDSKKVRNDRAKAELGWAPKHASYRAVLEAMLRAEG